MGTRLSRVRGLEHHGVTDIGVGRETRGDLDAVVLAASGLARLGLSAVVTDFLDPHRVLPAAGQGCLAVEYRTEDTAPEVLTALRALEDSATRVAVRAERALLLRLEAGCAAPVGAYAQLETDEAGAPVLVVSQFTLYADTRKGRRPTWNKAAPGEVAEPLVEAVAEDLRGRGLEVATGRFGADMKIDMEADGPVTILIEVE